MKITLLFLFLFNLLTAGFILMDVQKLEDNQLHIYFLDIGQGDAILLKTPSGYWGLIDSGKNSTVLQRLAEELPLFNHKLDFVLMTHPDADHIEGFYQILQRYEIDTVFVNKTAKQTELASRIKDLMYTQKLTQYSISRDNDFTFDGVSFDVIWPNELSDNFDTDDPNDTSISLIIKYGDFELYTAGDLSYEYENKAVTEPIDVDVLKASHHGSKTSTDEEILDKLTPEIAIISAGKDNSYGHPHAEVLENLEKYNAEVYRTDQEGTIEIKTDGINLEICSNQDSCRDLNL